MNPIRRLNALLLMLAVTLTGAFALAAQGPASVAGVGNSKFGTYRALAELSYDAFQRSDYATAAKLARVLERTWDHCETAFEKSSPEKFEEIDTAMDAFIKPVMHYTSSNPDSTKVGQAYKEYIERLTKADQ